MKYRCKNLPIYLMHMHIEEILDYNLKRKLIKNYRNGGVDFEDEVIKTLPKINKEWGLTINKSKEVKWIYVGDYWWCRKLKKYEFGKLYAIENNLEKGIQWIALWNEKIHGFVEMPKIVHSILGRRGIIVGWNKDEIFVQWEESNLISREKFEHLKFEFYEDHKYFSRLFG